MGIKEWKVILARFDTDGVPVRPVKNLLLSNYERGIGWTLPISYREYCQVFGPGRLTLPWGHAISTPHAISPAFNIDDLNSRVKGMAVANLVSDPEQFRRAVYFASDLATSDYFWDPDDVTDGNSHECGIYVMYRNLRVVRLCDAFWSFVNDFCTGSGIPGYDNLEDIELAFVPG